MPDRTFLALAILPALAQPLNGRPCTSRRTIRRARFTVGTGDLKFQMADCAAIRLDNDEQVTFVTDDGAEYDVARKDWGFYATPSLNGRLSGFGLRGVLIRNRKTGRYFVLLVRTGHEAEFEQYCAQETLAVVVLARQHGGARSARRGARRRPRRCRPLPNTELTEVPHRMAAADPEAQVKACYSTWAGHLSHGLFRPPGGLSAGPPRPGGAAGARVRRALAARCRMRAGDVSARVRRNRASTSTASISRPRWWPKRGACWGRRASMPDHVWQGSVTNPASYRGAAGNETFDAAICIGVLPHVPEEADTGRHRQPARPRAPGRAWSWSRRAISCSPCSPSTATPTTCSSTELIGETRSRQGAGCRRAAGRVRGAAGAVPHGPAADPQRQGGRAGI